MTDRHATSHAAPDAVWRLAAAYPPDTRFGLVSDTHGRVDPLRSAVERLRAAGASVFIHLGDVGSDAVLDVLAGLTAHVVFGNTDHDADLLGEYARHLGLHVDHPYGRVRVGDVRIAFAHGDDPRHERQARAEGARWFLHGHSHRVRDEDREGLRRTNPGALHRAARYTGALLDCGHDRIDFIEIPKMP